MTPDSFKRTTGEAAPPSELSPALQALWWAAKGDWNRAHVLVQDDPSREGAWVHAYLHRVEGDLGNAAYWYRKAGRPEASDPLEVEWGAIAAALLPATTSTRTGRGAE
ncbi:MAG: hypothetical protein E6G84_11955 [Alphaproteobacteria bacterium]|nr:MAG: hypothetical protein E6G84_11955 [Alphaproteobacteria bacterium]